MLEGVSPFWYRYYSALFLRRRLAAVLSLLAILFIGTGLGKLDIDFNIESMFPRDDRIMVAFREFTRLFGRDDDQLVLLCRVHEWEKGAFLPALDRLSQDARGLTLEAPLPATAPRPLFLSVSSLLDTPYPFMPDDLELRIGSLRDWLLPVHRNASPAVDPSRWASLLASLSTDGPVLGNFLAPASRTAILILRLSPEFADNQGRLAAVAHLRTWLQTHQTPEIEECILSGMPAARADGMVMIQRDQQRLLPISLALSMVIQIWAFRRTRDVALIIGHIVITLLVTLGLMGHAGIRFSILSSVTPVILVTTGSCYSIQIIARLRTLQGMYEARRVELAEVFASMTGPILLANLTTVIGFGSLINADMQLITEFALVTAGGVFIAFVLTATVFPLMVAATGADEVPSELPPAPGSPSHRSLGTRFSLRLGRLVTVHPRKIVAMGLLCGVLWGGLALKVQVRAFVFDDFWPDSPLMKHIRAAESACRGLLPISLVIRTRGEETVVRRHFLSKAEEAATFLRGLPEVGKVDSPSDLVSRIWAFLDPQSGSASEGTRLPPDDASLAHVVRLLLIGGLQDVGFDLVSRDLGCLRIPFRIHDLESRRAAELIDRIRAFAAGLEDARTEAKLTGTTVMIQEAYRHILGNLFWSFLVVITVTLLILGFAFRHGPTLLAAALGNLIPLLGVLAVMGVLGIPFKPSTTTIFGIALGLAVDNTIYFLREYWSLVAAGRSRRQIVRRALAKVGGGMLFSSASLTAGFLILLGSEFEAQYLIGLLLSFSVVPALFFDLLFVPAWMSLWGPAGTPWFPQSRIHREEENG